MRCVPLSSSTKQDRTPDVPRLANWSSPKAVSHFQDLECLQEPLCSWEAGLELCLWPSEQGGAAGEPHCPKEIFRGY